MMNFPALGVAALVPLVMGFIWYGPLFKNPWMKSSGVTEEMIKNSNMALILGLTLVLSFLAAIFINTVVVHQMGVFSLFANEPGFADAASESRQCFDSIMNRVGDKHRSFGHGFFHGSIAGIFLAMTVVATNALFERKNFTYIAIHFGYWTLTFALMGAILAAWK